MRIERKVQNGVLSILEDGKPILLITEKEENGTVNIAIEGSLKSDTVHDFSDELIALATLGADIRLDLSKTDYASSACIQAMITAQQRIDGVRKGRLLLCGVPKQILDAMDRAGASQMLEFEE